MISNQELLQKVSEVHDYVIKMRRYFHEYPELSGKEFNTSKVLQEEVRKCGLEVFLVPTIGFYAVLDTHRPGKTIGLRSDIDALPIQEQSYNLVRKRECISKHDGVMHACGHDGHMAVLLGAIKVLSEMKGALSGKLVFIFEEAEEVGGGIDAMIHALKPLNLNAVYGTHLASFMDTGTICIDAGPRMAGSVTVGMNVIGKSGHGSRPDLSINPVFAAAQIINALSSAWVNRLDVGKTVTLGLTQVQGGTANNVIPDSVFIGGTLRYFDEEAGVKAMSILKEVSELTAQAHRCRVEFGKQTYIATRPVINDRLLSKQQTEVLKEVYPSAIVHDITWYASESFNRYRELAPSLFAFVGMANEDFGSGAEHHNDYFDIDENALEYALVSTLLFALYNLK